MIAGRESVKIERTLDSLVLDLGLPFHQVRELQPVLQQVEQLGTDQDAADQREV